MSDDPSRFDALREKAVEALTRGDLALKTIGKNNLDDVASLLEELRIYQAELEVQNTELSASQRQAERNLIRFETLFESLPLPALVINRSGLIQEANTQSIEMFGFSGIRAIRQHSIYRLIDANDGGAVAGVIRDNGSTDMIPEVSIRAASGDAALMTLHVSRLPARFHLDEHFLILFVDQTDEVQHERDRDLFQALLDHTSALIYAFDRDGCCILANLPLQQFLGRSRQHLIGQRREQWGLSEEDIREQEKQDANVLATGKPLVHEYRLNSVEDGGTAYHLCEKFPLRSSDGKIYAVGNIVTDLTETRQRDARLNLAMELFSKGSEGILITNEKNEIITANKAFEQITGYTEAEVLGKKPSILRSGRHDRAFYGEMWRAISVHGAWEGEVWNRRKSGDIYPQWLSISKINSAALDVEHYVAVFSDITHRKFAEEEIHRLAFFDILTGTPNRHLLRDRVEQAIRACIRENTEFALCFIDLDHFKEVNDAFGHETGDLLLCEVVTRIRSEIRAQDTLSRLGGDEFVALLPALERKQLPGRVQSILNRLAAPFQIEAKTLTLSASIGIAIYPDDGADFTTLLKNADIAMYKAKAGGRNAFRFFNKTMAEDASNRMKLETSLRAAVGRNEMSLRYQPQISLTTGKMLGVEALLRWRHAEMGWVPPDRFIPIAEDARLIVPIGNWVLDQALGQRKQWLVQGFAGFPIAVNVSSRQFWSEHFVDNILDLLKKYDLPGSCLEIELTERVAMDNPEKAVEMMKMLRAAGVRLSIDDFGTGYSSLAYLRWMPVNVLKIDRSFVTDIGLDRDDEAICCSIIELAATLGIQTVAEGVETPVHAKFLKEKKCTAAQGYHFAHPLLAEELQPWLENSQ